MNSKKNQLMQKHELVDAIEPNQTVIGLFIYGILHSPYSILPVDISTSQCA